MPGRLLANNILERFHEMALCLRDFSFSLSLYIYISNGTIICAFVIVENAQQNRQTKFMHAQKRNNLVVPLLIFSLILYVYSSICTLFILPLNNYSETFGLLQSLCMSYTSKTNYPNAQTTIYWQGLLLKSLKSKSLKMECKKIK